MNKHLANIISIIQPNQSLSEEQKASILKSLKDADKELEIATFKLDRTEKVKRTTTILLEETIAELEQKRKAVEEQNKELEIEGALERIRSRSLAMHKSDELKEVVKLVFEILQELSFGIDGAAFIMTRSDDAESVNAWIGDNHAEYPTYFKIPKYSTTSIQDIWDAVESNTDFISKTYSAEEKNHWFRYAFEHTELRTLPDDLRNWILQQEYLTQSFSWANKSGLGIHFHHQRTLSEYEIDILKRFSSVFDQAYTRFLDLQKAEAQAREAKIEAALERVRSHTMAMQRSEELLDVASVLFQQVKALGVSQWNCGFNIWEIGDKEFTYYPGSPDGIISPSPCKIPVTEHAVFMRFDESRRRSEELLIYEKQGEEQADHYRYMLSLPGVGDLLRSMLDAGFQLPTFQIDHLANFAYGNLIFITYVHCPEMHDAFKRFAKVFEQTYTRFLDLQKAEAQARESQIQLALERVRARTMAMQRSDELPNAALLLFQQLQALGVPQFTCSFNIWDDDKKASTCWGAREDTLAPPFKTPSSEDIFVHILDAAQNGESLFVREQDGAELVNHYNYLTTIPEVKVIVDEMTKAGFSFPTFQIVHCAFFAQGYLMFITYSPVTEAHDIFKRFAKVFEQTYTRFLDLQKAEAQAREAKIEASLEKVRARTMAMQHSIELSETSALLFQQIQTLGVPPWSCGFNIWEQGDAVFTSYMGSPDGATLEGFKIPLTEEATFMHFQESRDRGDKLFIDVLEGETLEAHYRYFLSLPEIKKAFEKRAQSGEHHPTYQINHLANFSHGNLLFITYEPCPEAHDIFIRFAAVFEQTYVRFLDLQKAEAQAREAIKQASLDRVRGEIASMRSTEDLNRITPLVWKELLAMEVPFIRCGVFIVDESTSSIRAFLSAPDGRSLGVLNLPVNSSDLTIQIMDHWHQQKIYTTHWTREQFLQNMKIIISLGQIQEATEYQGAASPPESLHLHFINFKQGMLYVGNVEPLSSESIESVKSLADSFAIAFARYEDFKQLEAAKKSVDTALTELRATQSQLIQSEKMASLGELTAGIAHEIQNPLNFVNNFSEVSTELVDEMNEELQKGNTEDAMQIAADLKQNLVKINHHGKRAGDIVKGMLQHSRSSSGVKEPTNINALADEYLRLAYHGLRAKDKSFNATMKTDLDDTIGNIKIVPQDIGRVILNLINNAFYAVNERQKLLATSSELLANYEPTVSISTIHSLSSVEGRGEVKIRVTDNGAGIPDSIKEKIFQPFFTTKPTGQGTGLGLSLSYDIVKAHGGELKVETKEGEGSEFTIQLPNI